MGQRLVIVLKKNNKDVASCYVHNGGLSRNSIEFTRKVIEAAQEQQEDYHAIFKNVDTRIGFTGKTGSNRNIGLFDNDEKGIKKSIYAAEQLIYIDLDTMLIDFEGAFEIETKQESIENGNFTEENYEIEKQKHEDVTDKYLVPFDYERLLELERSFEDHQIKPKKWKTKDSIVWFVE